MPVAAVVVLGVAAAVALSLAMSPALRTLGDRMERERVAWERRKECEARLDVQVVRVLGCNAALHGLGAGPDATGLPEPLVLAGQSAEELRVWCDSVEGAVERARQTLHARTVERVRAALRTAAPPGPRVSREPAAVGPDRMELRERAKREELLAATERALLRMPADARARDRDRVDETARAIAAVGSVTEGRNLLTELRVRITEAQAATRTGRADRLEAAALVQPLLGGHPAPMTTVPRGYPALSEGGPGKAVPGEAVSGKAVPGEGPRGHAAVAAGGPDEYLALRRGLEQVMAGERALDAGLRAEALRVCERVRADAESAYLARLERTLTDVLTEAGYVVEDLGTARPVAGVLTVRRRDWDGVAAHLRVGRRGTDAVMVGRLEAEGAGAEHYEEARTEWCADVAALSAAFAGRGIPLQVSARDGDRPAPAPHRRTGEARGERTGPAGEARGERRPGG